ncbi:FadR/GntR family transcriptional regulator [Mycetocola spongiae]|uniref:FadR/GntR family transcriptional regulator n=1 Tax=Mycetocola spongiae TaxID=2859226 RepID=UPI001CF3D9E3|nr:FCD domain-containing protein [Mycetocola spongiae]UCR88888.1 FCD domain-containing protein [Mycetocola spongiae]
MEKPRRNIPLSRQAAEQLREQIIAGDWAVGTRIPTEAELGARWGISRNSVREAVRSLVYAGLLEARAGDGTYVRARSELGEVLRRRITPTQLGELSELRALLEKYAAGRAATHADAAALTALEEALDARDHAPSVAEYVRHDAAFHQIIAEASGNSLLAELYANLDAVATQLDGTTVSLDTLQTLAEPEGATHRDLLRAIASGESERAESVAGRLIAAAHRTQH